MSKEFWANVRTVSEKLGYTNKRTKQIKVYTAQDIRRAFNRLGLQSSHLYEDSGTPTRLGRLLQDYFDHRAHVLNVYVEPRLMDHEKAEDVFENLRQSVAPTCPLPMNKQTGEKKRPAFFTGIINMLIERHLAGLPCAYSPGSLTTFQRDGAPVRTLARRVDGCFPSVVNPVALWEIKEYYFTKTFGSRVADGVYETLLDGMELEELLEHVGIPTDHLLMVDDHFTWWEKGRSYLCRMIDMLHMGYVDHMLFGYEVVEQLPEIVAGWAARYRAQRLAEVEF